MSLWSLATLSIGCTITGYLFLRYTWCLDIGVPAKVALFMLCMLAGSLPLLNGYSFERFFGNYYTMYRNTLYSIFIFCVLLFTITLISDLLFGIIAFSTPLLKHISLSTCLGIKYANIVLALLCTIYAAYAGLKVPAVKEVVFQSDKITKPQKIVVLSDIHLSRTISADKIKGIVERTNALKPDAILLVGDIIDDSVSRVTPLTAILQDLRAKNGVYYATGNHEFYKGYQASINTMQKLGFTVLENRGVQLSSDIYLAGIPDTSAGRYSGKKADLNKAFATATPNAYRILMSHTPTDFGHKTNFDLEVSGHTHGGQIFPFHILTKLHNPYLSGQYKMSRKGEIYVSRGAGQWGPQLRFLAPSEITLLRLEPAKSN